MKLFFLITFIFVSTCLFSQRPAGLPSPSSNGWNKTGYSQADSGLIQVQRDTFTAKYPTIIRYTDGSLWQTLGNGARWFPVSKNGTYTPTLTKTLNLTGTPTLFQATYTRIGNIVTVSIGVNISATSSGSSVLTFTLPFTTSTTNQSSVGIATVQENSGTNYAVGIIDVTSGTQATLTYKATTTGSSDASIVFQYYL